MSNSFCIYPWIHIQVKPNGQAKPCCRFNHMREEYKDDSNNSVMAQYNVNKQSLYNTPPVFSIYTCMLNMEWILKSGGIEEIEKKNIEKAISSVGSLRATGGYRYQSCPFEIIQALEIKRFKHDTFSNRW